MTLWRTFIKGVAMGACLVSLAGSAFAQSGVTPPLHIGTSAGVVNEFNELHAGTPEAYGALVQVLQASTGLIHPPDAQGHPHPDNPPLAQGETYIGALVGRSPAAAGRFGLSVVDRPETGTLLFVRVFNQPTVEGSIYYGDSIIKTVTVDRVLNFEVAATDQIIDPYRDTDADGLPDWWEWIHFTNVTAVAPHEDADGDGMTAWEEWLAGTHPNNPASALRVDPSALQSSSPAVRWQTVPGRTYALEYTQDALTANPTFITLHEAIIAHETETEIPVPSELIESGRTYFRIRLVL